MSLHPFSYRLRQLIESKDFKSANEFALGLGYDSSEKIGRLLRDPKNKPSFEILQDIANKFPDVDMNWLITGTNKIETNLFVGANEPESPYNAVHRDNATVGRESETLTVKLELGSFKELNKKVDMLEQRLIRIEKNQK